MRILLCHPGAEFSIWDVGQGLRAALVDDGHEIADYYLTRRMLYHANAMEAGGADVSQANISAISKQASENVIVEALYHRADLIIVISGLNFHPIGLWLLDQMREPRIPIALVLTESPYEDAQQATWLSAHSTPIVFTNERISAQRYGWHYLPHAYDPVCHRPMAPDPAEACDVLMVATGWQERQTLLEQVDWTGIKLRLLGPWPYLSADHPLKAYHEDCCIKNEALPRLVASAKICLNYFRAHDEAESLGPRSYELAACGAFQLSDPRPELTELFGESVPTFSNSQQLESQIRYYIAHDEERLAKAAAARAAVRRETFTERVDVLLGAVRGATSQRVEVGVSV